MVNKKIVIIIVLALIVGGTSILFLNRPKSPLSSPLSTQTKKVVPSEIFLEYSDPSGFTFSYPDNLSITKKEVDESTYADLQLFSNEVNGSLSLKISDSQFKSIDDWVKSNTTGETPKEVKLGNLKALELRLKDRLLMAALDQGIEFNIEMPLLEEDFWMKVYNKVLESFSFVAPQTSASDTTSLDDVIFEGEEVVE